MSLARSLRDPRPGLSGTGRAVRYPAHCPLPPEVARPEHASSRGPRNSSPAQLHPAPTHCFNHREARGPLLASGPNGILLLHPSASSLLALVHSNSFFFFFFKLFSGGGTFEFRTPCSSLGSAWGLELPHPQRRSGDASNSPLSYH